MAVLASAESGELRVGGRLASLGRAVNGGACGERERAGADGVTVAIGHLSDWYIPVGVGLCFSASSFFLNVT